MAIVLNDGMKRRVDLLVANGLPKYEAAVLVCVAARGEMTTYDLVVMTGLQQPVISVTTTSLAERGWLSRVKHDTPRGRPYYTYELGMPMQDIIREIVTARSSELRAMEARVQELIVLGGVA
jgi:predicted transcriptional regulator